ncbi:DUF937 domain-containing protein [Craterilacuibacter sp.]|uniref:DUF937 domain-containing protein n=1 Tax=Craterilacuibacter sp. TaxID=2870909 RepID=UPI003F40348B
MNANLLDTLKQGLAGPFTELAAQHLGEPATGIKSALGAAIPALLASLIKENTSAGGTNKLLGLINAPNLPLLQDVGTLLTPDKIGVVSAMGQQQLSSLFGQKLAPLTSSLSSESNFKLPAMGKLLALVTPFVLGFIRHQAGGGTIDASTLSSLFKGQESFLSGRIPAAIASVLGLGSLIGAAPKAVAQAIPDAGHKIEAVAAKSGFGRWWLWLLGLAAILFSIFQFRSCSQPDIPPELPKIMEKTVSPAPAPAASTAMELPALADKPPLIRVYFDTDVFAPPANSKNELAAIVEYAKNHPAAKISISGYHDKTGEPAHNIELAKNRATAVQKLLTEAGIQADRIVLEEPAYTVADMADNRESRRVEVEIK